MQDAEHMSLDKDMFRCAGEQVKCTLEYVPRQVWLHVLQHVEKKSLQVDIGYAVLLGLWGKDHLMYNVKF